MVTGVPQRRYQDALRAIKRRLGISHHEAQAVYRFQRSKLGPSIPASKFEGYSKSHLQRVRREAVKSEQKSAFSGTDAAFDLRRLSDSGQVPKITAQDTPLLTAEFRSFFSTLDEQLPQMKVERLNVKKDEFWLTYHDMAREAIDRATGRQRRSPDALLVASVDIL